MEQTFNVQAVLALTAAEHREVQRIAGEIGASWSEAVQLLLASGLFTWGLLHDDESAFDCGVAMVDRTGNDFLAAELSGMRS